MPKNCDNCGTFCEKRPSVRHKAMWVCPECGCRFPKRKTDPSKSVRLVERSSDWNNSKL